MRRRLLITSAACVSLIALAIASPAEGSELKFGAESRIEVAAPPAEFIGDYEKLTLPPVSAAQHEFINQVTERLGDDPRFNVVEVAEDRTAITVWWHGEPSAELNELVADAESPVQIGSVAYLPADLKAIAGRLVGDENVESVEIPQDGSHLVITTPRASQKRSTAPQADAIEREIGVPVVLQTGGIEAAALERQYDTYALGGARMYRWANGQILGGCTSGFPVQKGSTYGVMFAAHCGEVNSQWMIHREGTLTVERFGGAGYLTDRDPSRDGAVAWTVGNNPYIYTSTWNSSAITPINGATSNAIGTEICYSGSYSGLTCGNIVQAQLVYNLNTTDLTNISGYRTVQNGGTPAVGNGDSGGPGYTLVTQPDGTVKRYAALIISAIPRDSPPNCQGVPGSSAEGGRKCSPTAFGTPAQSIAASLGWTFSTLP